MKEKFSYVIATLIIATIIVVGVTLINIGNTPLLTQIIHLIGFLLLFIGVVAACIEVLFVWSEIDDYFHLNRKREKD